MIIECRRRFSLGQTTTQNLVVLLVLALIVVLIWRLGVPVIRKMLLEQQIDRFVNWDRENQRDPTDESVMCETLVMKARHYGFKASDKDLKFYYDPDERVLTIKMDYVIPIDLFLFDFDWKVHVEKTTEPM